MVYLWLPGLTLSPPPPAWSAPLGPALRVKVRRIAAGPSERGG